MHTVDCPAVSAAETATEFAVAGVSPGSADLQNRKHGSRLRAAGLVTMRQRPTTAGDAVFFTLEDESGVINVVVWHDLTERQRRELIGSRLLVVDGKGSAPTGVEYLIASRLSTMTPPRSRDFR